MGFANGPLRGRAVIELGTGIAGGYCTKILTDAGAAVYKIERPAGDPLRAWSATAALAGESVAGNGALFQYLYAGARSIVLEPPSTTDLAQLLGDADALVLNGRAALDEWSLDRNELARSHPDLVTVEISPFGATGPSHDLPADEFTLQAIAGSMYSRGVPDRAPLAAGGSTGDWIAGAYAALAVLAGWRNYTRTGTALWADLSILEALVLTHTVFQPLAESMGQPRSQLTRNVEIPSIEPAKDGWVGFCTVQARVWHDFCAMVGHPEWATDPALRQWAGRAQRIDELRGAIAEWLRDKTVDEVIELASLLRIAVAPVTDGSSAIDVDHFVDRGVFVETAGRFVQPRPPYQIETLGSYEPAPAPELGDSIGFLSSARLNKTTRHPAGDPRPLAGLRAVDFTGAWAGSYCAQLVAQLGAEVIKIESITHPDPARMGSVKQPGAGDWWEWAPIFHGVNTDKQAITLDLDTAAGHHLAAQLITCSDIVLENFSPRVMDHFRLGWDQVRAINPRAIMVRMPAFGLSGPWRDRIGFAQTMEQASGMAAITGYADGQPIIPKGLCDPLGGLHGTIGLLIALAHREQTGEGQLVEASMIEAALNIAAEPIVEYAAYGRLLTRAGNRRPGAVPSGVFRCAGDDEWLAISVGDDAQWAALLTATDAPPSMRTERLGSALGRRAHEDSIEGFLSSWCARRDAEHAAGLLGRAGVAAARVARQWEVHENAQLIARGFFESVVHPIIGTHDRYPGMPFAWRTGPRRWHRTPAPTLGEHNDAVLRGLLGLDDQTIAELQAQGVIGRRPRHA